MIGIIDYGAGNLFSVKNALDYLKIESVISADIKILEAVDALVLPGVGAFPDAMAMLEKSGLVPVIREQVAHKPLLGICLGMQLLFETGYEFNETKGLGLLPGTVIKIDSGDLKIPHMGWNTLKIPFSCPMTADCREGDAVYFVHSYRVETEDQLISCYAEYHEKIPALVCQGNLYGAQFHPEKSGIVGLEMLKNFAKVVTT